MGKRVTFYRSKSGKTLKAHFIKDFLEFRNWLLHKNEESIKDFSETLINEELRNSLERNQKFEDFFKESQKVIDQATVEYLLVYCDYGKGNEYFEIVGPMMNSWRYKTSTDHINRQSSQELRKLWNIILNGISIKNGQNFIPFEGDVIGFWTPEDQILLDQLLGKFTTNQQMTLEGITYVREVIEEVKSNGSDLIVNIEI
ncbi:MAG: hypothetical protein AAF824_06170 [Bacteroidota bacterium]